MSSDRTILENPSALPPVPGDVTILEQPAAPPSATARSTAQRVGLPGPRTARIAAGEVRPPLVLTVGAVFRDYKLERPIEASSAEADLWVLTHHQTGEPAVLKLYRYGIQPKREILEALKFLRHSSVVRVIESGTTDGRSFEIQEFIEHGTLASAFGEGPLPPEQLRALLRELTEALADVHAAGIIHRDLKPSNILVRSREPLDVVLADFGISSFSDLSLHLSNANRTAAYAAPEAMTGVVTRTSDWWSIGVMMLALLRGEHPFAGLDERAINFTLVTRGIEVPTTLPADWALLLRGLLTRDHQKRWSLDQVRAWLDGQRDIAIHEALDAGPAPATARTRTGYKFAGTEYLEPSALAGVLGSHWNDGVKQLARGYVQRWVEAQVGDEELASVLQDIADDDHLDAELRLSATLLALDPALPLIWRGQVVDATWLVAHATLPRPNSTAIQPPVHPDDLPLLRLTRDSIREQGIATTPVIERCLDVSPGRARRLLDTLESRGCLGPDRGKQSREIRFDLHGGGGDLASEAALLLQSSLPAWLKRLRGDEWLTHAAVKRREAWLYIHAHRLQLNPELADQLLLSPHEGVVWSLVEERRRQFAGSTEETLDRLLGQTDELTFAEAVALAAAEPTCFISQERALISECIDWLNRLHFRYDRALAEQLVLARDWELVGRHWNTRHEEFGGAVPSALQALFELENPEYLEAVAVACAERGLFISREAKVRTEALAWFDQQHFAYDRALAAQLALAQDWNALLGRWSERRGSYVEATPEFLNRILLCESPAYLEVVALVAADRLHFRTEAHLETAARMRSRFGKAGRVTGWGATNTNPSLSEVPATCGQVIVAIAAGANHNLALRDDGRIVAWGSSANATRVPADLEEVTAIAAGHDHCLALREDGTVIAWGSNAHGQCAVPAGLSEIIAVAAGGQHSLALRADGRVFAWGGHAQGQCTQPKNLPPIAAIAAGSAHTLALARDGRVFAWGGDDCSQCSVPWLLSGVVAIAAGAQHSLALDDRGRVHAWGAGAKNEGRPPHCGQALLPTGMTGVTRIAAGAFHSLALAGEKLFAWGDRRAGQTSVPFLAGEVLTAAGGANHSLALIAVSEESTDATGEK